MVGKNIFGDSIFRNKTSGNENQSICQTPLKKKETRGASRGSSWDVHSLLSLQQRSNCTQANFFSFCCLSPVAQFSHHMVWDNVQNRLWSTRIPGQYTPCMYKLSLGNQMSLWVMVSNYYLFLVRKVSNSYLAWVFHCLTYIRPHVSHHFSSLVSHFAGQ